MITITVASGKGGAGKTSVSSALAAGLGHRGILADCDVDAANAAIAMNATLTSSTDYYSGDGYQVDAKRCTGCGLCQRVCRFDAFWPTNGIFTIDEALCERCGACADACPSGAIITENKLGGKLMVSRSFLDSAVVHAELVPGEDTSGKLAASVRRRAEDEAERSAAEGKPIDAIVVDAPPGIGCPVIASLTRADMVVVVIEAGSSGVRDAERLFELCASMNRKTGAVINKAGMDPEWDRKARELAGRFASPVLADLPWDRRFRQSTERAEAWVLSQDRFVAESASRLCSAVYQLAGLPSVTILGS